MMRTAQFLKFFSYGVLVVGITMAFQLFSFASPKFWIKIMFSIVAFLVLRLLAIVGELIYGMRNDVARMLTSIERSLYHSNALSKEIRDLVESQGTSNKP
ncbi:MAG: hypothetical protein KTQ49_02480 [Candidatus Omnitrophica bacterium]|nr:hypothetical protein [Candidatus Omnitrophota bacterium]